MKHHPALISGPYFLPYYPPLVEHAKRMRKEMTLAEGKLWYQYLRTYRPRILRQRPIDFYKVDFYCAAARLVIEVDGSYHLHPDQAQADACRTVDLEQYGLMVIRFSNQTVMQNFEEVCRQINDLIQTRKEKLASIE